MTGVSESKFHILRSLVSLAHVDGRLDVSESNYLTELFDRYRMSYEQEAIIAKDFEIQKNLSQVFTKIKGEQDHKTFFYLARILCLMDGEVGRTEVAVLEKLQELYLDKRAFKKKIEETQNYVDHFIAKEKQKPSKNKLVSAFTLWDEDQKKAA
jgi:uncharacterized membrane protein YebE (DUF533 family)